MSILEDIVKNKQRELDGLPTLPALLTSEVSKSSVSFTDAITRARVGIIAEIKKKSPSAGDLAGGHDLVVKAQSYEEAGADAISVVTDQKYFGGSLQLFQDIRKATSLPMLMKDFIIHPYQVIQAEQAGADALLVIAALNTYFHPDLLKTLFASSITPVIEVAHTQELSLPFVQEAEIIGVNARNLNTFQIDIDRACSIIKKISKEKTVIAFSGVKSRSDVNRYKTAGAKAVLVGEILMKAKDYNLIPLLKA
ncbi:MAG: indole-3-glycerol-phosphate synthase [Candidatus Roizmanbacteria bacterium]|nr:indole-3-glycerol-phosphate synthase [Candidatus Roizmanbacteria bacterium]